MSSDRDDSPAIPPSEPVHPDGLAVAPDGSLYVADRTLNVIFKLSAAGTFSVVTGFDDQEYPFIDNPGGMIFRPDGTLLFADEGNNCVRSLSPAGVLTTVAGACQQTWSRYRVTSSGVATREPVSDPSDVDLDNDGGFDIAANPQVLHVDAHGILTLLGGNDDAQGLDGIGGPALSGSMDGPDGVATNSAGMIYVSGFNTKALLDFRAGGDLGVLDQAFYSRGFGGLRRAPDGSIIAMDDEKIVRYRGAVASTIYDFGAGPPSPVGGFQPDGLAVGPNGDIWVSTFAGNGYADRSAIVRIDTRGHESVVWQSSVQ